MTSGPPKAPTPHEAEERGPGPDGARSSLAAQWIGVFLAPAAFFAHLQIAYVLVPWSCTTGNHLWLGVTDALSTVVAAMGTVVAWRVWSLEGEDHARGGAGPSSRARFLGLLGAGMGATLVVLLAAQWSASWLISPCH